MKKILTLIIALALVFSLAACKGEKDNLSESYTSAHTSQSETGNTEDKHTHSFSDANCTEAKKCSCGATEGEALGHSFSDATCTEPKKCRVCGATEGEALGHSFSDATCTEPKKCKVCAATEGLAAGHSWKEATCKAPKTCSICSVTEGGVGTHVYENGICKSCQQEEIVPPAKLEMGRYYAHFEEFYDDALGSNGIRINIIRFWENGACDIGSRGVWLANPGDAYGYIEDTVSYKGTTYYLCETGGGSSASYEINQNKIVIRSGEAATENATLEILSNAKIKVVSKTSGFFGGNIETGNIYELTDLAI